MNTADLFRLFEVLPPNGTVTGRLLVEAGTTRISINLGMSDDLLESVIAHRAATEATKATEGDGHRRNGVNTDSREIHCECGWTIGSSGRGDWLDNVLRRHENHRQAAAQLKRREATEGVATVGWSKS